MRVPGFAGIARREVSAVRSAIGGLGRIQAVVLLVGAGTVAYGGFLVLGLLLDGTAPLVGVGAWWLAGPLVVDLIAVPAVVVAGVAIGRIVPPPWRRYVAVSSVLTVLVTLVAFPFLTGLGRRADNPSLLDRNYALGHLTLVGIIWGLPLLVHVARMRAASRRDGD